MDDIKNTVGYSLIGCMRGLAWFTFRQGYLVPVIFFATGFGGNRTLRAVLPGIYPENAVYLI